MYRIHSAIRFLSPIVILSVSAVSIPSVSRAQNTQTDPAAGVVPLEVLQSRGQQSAVRVLAYTFVSFEDVTKRVTGGRVQGFYQLYIGLGVRFVVSNRVMTALSVVAGADSIEVEVGSRRMPATLLGVDDKTQLAFLSVNDLLSSNAPPQPSAVPVQEGDIVLLVDTLRDRTVLLHGEVRFADPFSGLIVTTLPLYPGMSGAPLLNPRGELVGIAAFSLRNDLVQLGPGDAAAVPMDLAGHVAMELEEFGRVRWGWFGATSDSSITDRLVLSEVVEGSPAQLAGLQTGDVVTHYGGTAIIDAGQLRDLVLATAPGTVVPVQAIRDETGLDVNLVVGEWQPVVAQQDVLLQRPSYAEDAMALAQLRAIFEELTRVFSLPGFDTANPDIKTRLIRLERELNELKKVSIPDRPPPPVSY